MAKDDITLIRRAQENVIKSIAINTPHTTDVATREAKVTCAVDPESIVAIDCRQVQLRVKTFTVAKYHITRSTAEAVGTGVRCTNNYIGKTITVYVTRSAYAVTSTLSSGSDEHKSVAPIERPHIDLCGKPATLSKDHVCGSISGEAATCADNHVCKSVAINVSRLTDGKTERVRLVGRRQFEAVGAIKSERDCLRGKCSCMPKEYVGSPIVKVMKRAQNYVVNPIAIYIARCTHRGSGVIFAGLARKSKTVLAIEHRNVDSGRETGPASKNDINGSAVAGVGAHHNVRRHGPH